MIPQYTNDTNEFIKKHAEKGLYFLQHRTKLDFLADILNKGFLIPRSQQIKPNRCSISYIFNAGSLRRPQKEPNRYMGGNPNYVYFAPLEPALDEIGILKVKEKVQYLFLQVAIVLPVWIKMAAKNTMVIAMELC